MRFFLLAVTFLGLVLNAGSLIAKSLDRPTEFCQQIQNPSFFIERLQQKDNLLAFVNQGGFQGMGVCWWHSMMTRNANYLAVFRPDLPRLRDHEMIQLIRDLTGNNAIVEIPGFKNLWDFSEYYQAEFQTVLDQWQIVDGILFAGWLRGISGEVDVPPEVLKTGMDQLYEMVVLQKQVTYQKLQIPGIVAHSWLVVDMLPIEKGYLLTVVDSNYSLPYQVFYQEGQTHLNNYRAVPYTSRNTMDMWGYELAQKRYCRSRVTSQSLRDQTLREQAAKEAGMIR